jgi:tripartite-type tricarboxylate transporter receptor subunit TctC
LWQAGAFHHRATTTNWRKNMTRLLRRLLTAAVACMAPVAASATDYPNGQIVIVIPFTPGGSNDLAGRYLADGLSALWDVPVIVENRPGAGSAIGSAHVATSNPDGQKLLFVSGTYTTNAATQTDLPFDPVADLQPVAMAALGDRVVVTGSQFTTLAELVEAAKTQELFYGTTGVGSSTQFDTEFLCDVLGVSMKPVHYKGGADALIDLAGGRLDVYVGSVTQVMTMAETGDVNIVAVMSKERARSLPDVPTVAEAGYPGAETYIWWGVLAPSGTPSEVTEKINAGVQEVMASPDAAQFLEQNGFLAPEPMSVAEFTAHVHGELARWKDLVARTGGLPG